MTHDLWTRLNRTVVDYLDSVSLQDLVDQQRMRQLEHQTDSPVVQMKKTPDALASVIA